VNPSSYQVLEKYEALAEEHGVGTTAGLGWKEKEQQELRHRVLLQGLEVGTRGGKEAFLKGNLLDVGCGIGDFINVPGFSVYVDSYTGVDFLKANIERLKVRYTTPNFHFVEGEFIDKTEELKLHGPYTFAVASGLFSYYAPIDISRMLNAMWALTKEVMAFNVMIPRYLPTYHDLELVLKMCEVDRWVIRHDYLPDEVTVYAYKGE
jgi:hypothetical protein